MLKGGKKEYINKLKQIRCLLKSSFSLSTCRLLVMQQADVVVKRNKNGNYMPGGHFLPIEKQNTYVQHWPF